MNAVNPCDALDEQEAAGVAGPIVGPTILSDARRIHAIWDGRDTIYSCVEGYEIQAYGEPGIHCDMPFYRVLKKGAVVARVPAWQVQVSYAHP